MKKILKIIILSIITLNFFSCNNESEGLGIINVNERIKQVVFYDTDGDLRGTDAYYYDDNKIIEIVGINKDNYEYFKQEYDYNASTVTAVSYTRHSPSLEWNFWIKTEYLIENDLMKNVKSYEFTDNQWVETNDISYQYNSGQLSSWLNTIDLIGISKGNCIYTNNQLTELHEFIKNDNDEWIQKSKDIFTYSGSRLNGWTNYFLKNSNDQLVKRNKIEYSYQNNNISSNELYTWNADTNNWEINTEYSTEYLYNSNNHIIESQKIDGRVLKIEYEDGGENLELFRLPNKKIYKWPRFF